MEDSPMGGSDIRGQYLFATQSPKVVAGIFCTLLVVFLWVGSSELSQFIFDNADYSKPFFMTAFNTSLFSVYLLGFLIFPSWSNTDEYSSAYDVHISGEDEEESESEASEVEAVMPLLPKSLPKVSSTDSLPDAVSHSAFPMVPREPSRSP
eukprot:CAMPEP_0172161328 /NCGR_PEP_ID=MMETSP1050-20130122/6068_1 /TAXON_ID=233186 /ORGANISM="Cryptomonas curvata, Strain CCAP979/52" /LENGTH=150 /DNA_ID=CAMNT_0012831221 /DNA_START=171 /DNA_END=619 /DNA_ORIENTATION=+